MDRLKNRINALHPKWGKRPHLTANELQILSANAEPWMSVTDEDWRLLTAFMDTLIPPSWRRFPGDLLQHDHRPSLIAAGPCQVLDSADRWRARCRREGIPTGLEPETENATADFKF